MNLDIKFDFSNYLNNLLKNKRLKEFLFEKAYLEKKFSILSLYNDLKNAVFQSSSIDETYKTFREFKQIHFLRIAFLDFIKKADFLDVVSQISDVASVCLQVGLEFLNERPDLWTTEENAYLWRDKLSKSNFLILGFGKLGGKELNYVSDIDIAYFYQTEDLLHKGLINLFFQNLTKIISEIKHGDRVFEVDLRLRPAGKESEIATTVDFALEYYLNFGNIWDRIALLKASVVSGDRILGSGFLQEIKPFVFRRFLDFQSLKEVKSIRDKIANKSLKQVFKNKIDLKLGIGGIREIEFFVQAFQLIYGGRFPQLQEKNTLKALKTLGELELVPEKDCEFLKEAYIFLRRLEHCVQLENNIHTSMLVLENRKMNNFARALGIKNGENLYKILTLKMHKVNELFKSLFEPATPSHTLSVKRERFGLEECLTKFSTNTQREILEAVEIFGKDLHKKSDNEIFSKGILRIKRFLSASSTRSGIKKLIDSSLPWFNSLLKALFCSNFVSSLLSSQPSLIEGLNDKKLLSFNSSIWQKRALELIEGYSPDEKLERIRKVKNERLLFLTLMDITGSLNLKEILHHLSELADFVINNTYFTLCEKLKLNPDLPFAICGLGKLGTKEMGYFSDLDLMFVWDGSKDKNSDIIPEKIVRLVQRLLRMLSINLQEGPGYDVDTRIRPSGNYGPLITTKNNWEEYYLKEADIWEIQSLLKFRFVCGNKELGSFLEKIAEDICFKKHDPIKIWNRITYLRKRIEKERAEEDGIEKVDIKLGVGGLVDVEFFIQGIQLSKGYMSSSLRERNTFLLLENIFKNLPEETAIFIKKGFYELRWLLQRFHLYSGLKSSSIKKNQFKEVSILNLWPPDNSPLITTWDELLSIRKKIRKFWNETIKAVLKNKTNL